MKKRGFEVVARFQGQPINLPYRTSKYAAGYDFEASEEVLVQPSQALLSKGQKPVVMIPTGIKAYMQPDEFLLIANRSSNATKRYLSEPNGIGVIDKDYYGNDGNDGEIMLPVINFGTENYIVKKGDRVAQGIFMPYLLADDDHAEHERLGGFGSSGN